MKNMFVVYAVMFTIRLKVIRKAAFLLGHLLRSYRQTGFVRFAGRRRVNSPRSEDF